jgi:integrase
MGVYQRKERGGAWYYRFKIDKVPFKEKCLMPNGKPPANRFEALQCEKAAREAAMANAPRPKFAPAATIRPNDVTLEEAFAWHVAKIENEAGQTHLLSLGRAAREALAFFGEGRRLLSITDKDILDFRASVIRRKRRVFIGGPEKNPDPTDESLWRELDKRRSPAEQNHVLNALRSAFKAAYRMRDAAGRPMIPFLPVIERVHVPRRRPTPMSADEMNRRRAVAAPWVQDAIDLARHFGLRLSEALSVRVRHLDFDRRVINFRGEEVKSGNDQVCHTTPEGWQVALHLARQARERGVDHLVTYPAGKVAKQIRGSGTRRDLAEVPPESIKWKPMKSIRRAWSNTAKAAGIENPRRFHDLRAAYITEIAQHEKSGKKIQGVARHASFSTTERYIEIADSELVGVMDVVAKARKGKTLTMPAPANSHGARRPAPTAKRRKAR